MFGALVGMPRGSTVELMPTSFEYEDNEDSEDYDIPIEITVEDITFQVSYGMLAQKREPALCYNYFTRFFHAHGIQERVVMKPEAGFPPQLYQAQMYPFLFDFLRRRFDNPEARVHMVVLKDWDARQHLSILETFLFPGIPEKLLLPMVDDDKTYVIVPPPLTLDTWETIQERKHSYPASMCVDPDLVRLVMLIKHKNHLHQWENMDAGEARALVMKSAHHQQIMQKYELQMEDLFRFELHQAYAGERIELNQVNNNKTLRLLLLKKVNGSEFVI